MLIIEWLSPQHSTLSVSALVEVPAGETADFDAMVDLVNNRSGHFGASVKLVGVGMDGPPVTRSIGRGSRGAIEQDGYSSGEVSRQKHRYYIVRILRD